MVVSRFARKVRTASGAVAVQVVTRRGRQVELVEHMGSAHTDAELALLLGAARERLSQGQDVLDLGDLLVVPARMDDVADWTANPELPLRPARAVACGRPAVVAAGGRVVGTSADLLWEALTSAYARLGFDVLGDDGFRAMVLVRIVEPTSKADVVRVLDEIGAPAVSLRTLARSQAQDYRGQLATAAWTYSVHASGVAAQVLYDVTTLHFERPDEDKLQKVGMSKEHRVDQQVLVGQRVDPGRVPVGGAPVRGQQGRDDHPDPRPDRFPGPARDHGHGRGRRRRDALGGQPERPGGRGVLLHRGLEDHQGPRRPGRALRPPRELLHRRADPGVGP